MLMRVREQDACACVVELAKVAPAAVGRNNAALAKAMMPSTAHPHLAVRRAVVLVRKRDIDRQRERNREAECAADERQALGPVVAVGSNTVLDELAPALNALATDPCASPSSPGGADGGAGGRPCRRRWWRWWASGC
jgi:hypothetical protein